MDAEEEGFVHLQADSFLYSDAQIQAFLKAQQPFIGLSALLPDGAVASYPPLSPQDRLALLYQTPSALAQAQLTYYLLRDRALTLALEPPDIEPHPHAVLWAARNPLKLSPSQAQLTDALWLIDHAHLDKGIDVLLTIAPTFALDQDILSHLFFRLEAEAHLERIDIASWHPSIRNHAGVRPPAARRLVQFASHFQSAGIDTLFESTPDAVKAFLVSLCRTSTLAKACNWLQQHYSDHPADLYNDLLVALIESIATPNPLRHQLFELVSLPFPVSDLQILQSYATSIPPSSIDTASATSSRKVRAIIAETLFVRYIQRGQYADALALDAQLQLLSHSFDPTLFETPKASRAPRRTMNDEDILMAGTEADAQAADFEARRKRRADLLRAARDVMPDVQRALLDVKRIQSAFDAVNPGSSGQDPSAGAGVEGSWQDVSQEEVAVAAAEHADQSEVEVPAGRRSGPSASSGRGASASAARPLVPLTSSSALRGGTTGSTGTNSGTTSANTGTALSSTILHTSDPQAALISALVSSNVDEISSSAAAPSARSNPDASVTVQANRSYGSFSNAAAARPSPAGSRLVAAATSSFGGGAPSPQSFGSPRHRLTNRAASSSQFLDLPSPLGDQTANLSQNGHLAYMFRQPERRYVATVDIVPRPATSNSTVPGGSTERWAADQNMLLAGGEGDESLAKIPFPGEEGDDDDDEIADNTFRNVPTRTGGGAANVAPHKEKDTDEDEDGDMSVQMPGAWDSPAAAPTSARGNRTAGTKAVTSRKTGRSQSSVKRSAISSGEEAGGQGMEDDEVVPSQSRSARTKRTRRTPAGSSSTLVAIAAPPASDAPGPASSTPAAKRTSDVLARRPRGGATGAKAPSGLRQVTRSSSRTPSVSSSVSAEDEGGMEVDESEDGNGLPEMVELEGNAPPTVLARTTTTAASRSGTASRKSRASASSTTTAAATSRRSSSRRSSRLASQEPTDAAEAATTGRLTVNDILEEETEGEATTESASVSEAGDTETETEGEVEGETKGKTKKGRAKAGSGASKKKETSAATAKPRATRAGRTAKRA